MCLKSLSRSSIIKIVRIRAVLISGQLQSMWPPFWLVNDKLLFSSSWECNERCHSFTKEPLLRSATIAYNWFLLSIRTARNWAESSTGGPIRDFKRRFLLFRPPLWVNSHWPGCTLGFMLPSDFVYKNGSIIATWTREGKYYFSIIEIGLNWWHKCPFISFRNKQTILIILAASQSGALTVHMSHWWIEFWWQNYHKSRFRATALSK